MNRDGQPVMTEKSRERGNSLTNKGISTKPYTNVSYI